MQKEWIKPKVLPSKVPVNAAPMFNVIENVNEYYVGTREYCEASTR